MRVRREVRYPYRVWQKSDSMLRTRSSHIVNHTGSTEKLKIVVSSHSVFSTTEREQAFLCGQPVWFWLVAGGSGSGRCHADCSVARGVRALRGLQLGVALNPKC